MKLQEMTAVVGVSFALSLAACSGGGGNSKGFIVTVTGESSATEGNAFPPATDQEVVFKDGWQLEYEHVLVTIDHITLSENPDRSPTDPSQTGDPVARLDGPFVVDLAKAGPLDSKEMNGKAWRLGAIANQNLVTGMPAFSSTTKYAFGFELVAAASGATDVDLDADAKAAYQLMQTKGWTVLMKGTATWRGDLGNPACRSTNASYDWSRVPKVVHFQFGFKAPVTFKNCVNPELSPADSRGVQTQLNGETVAQATFHLDHPFWESLEEDAPLRFDAIAARKSVMTGPAPAAVDVTEADLIGVELQSFKDAQGLAMPIRFCGAQQTGEPTAGTLGYDPKNVPVNPLGGEAGLKDLYDYMTYNLSTFGHLNNDGLCFPARNFAAP